MPNARRYQLHRTYQGTDWPSDFASFADRLELAMGNVSRRARAAEMLLVIKGLGRHTTAES